MRLLVLGGTKFLGRATVEAALERGHEVTLFNRGQTNPELFPGVERLSGDRDGDLAALAGREWDAAIDPSGYVPRVVRASAELLEPRVGHYVFVSSISVYAEPLAAGADESAPLIELDDPATEDVMATPESYGGLKALCERVVAETFPGRYANARAGLIVGPHDPTGRFTYWPERVARGGTVLAPGDPDRQVQLVDARDLGAWMVDVAERGVSGDFNATGPEPTLTMRGLLEACRRASGSNAELVWVDEEFLLENDAGPWLELPLWLPGEDAHMLQVSVARATEAGLRFRPLEETARDTLEWVRDGGGTSALASGLALGEAGLKPEKEAELLRLWKERG